MPPDPEAERRRGAVAPADHPLVAVGGALGAVAVAMLLGHLLASVLQPAYVVSIFLVAVLAAAALLGLWSGLVAAIASFFAFDFFFVEPTFTFNVADPREVFALGVFLAAAVLTGGLAGRLRETADAARRRADTLAMLQDFAERASATTEVDEIRSLVARRVAGCIDGAAVLIDRRGGSGTTIEAWPPPTTPSAEEARAIEEIFAAAKPTSLASGRFVFRPLVTADGVVAVIGLARDAVRFADPHREDGLVALLDQAAVALERARFAEERLEAKAAAEEERLRSALLSSISHDLRTPLATILGSVTSLRQLGDRMAPEDRADLLSAIEEETDRLSRFVGDLLLMTRLEAGLDLRRDWIDVDDVVAAAAVHLRRVHPDHPIHTVCETGPVPLRGDATLLEQVLFNIGDNAAKASPVGSPIVLTLVGEADFVVISVVDLGRGLSPEEIHRLFEGGEARDARPAPERRGGLGLSIARRVVAAMGGTISAESRTTDVPGTRVTLRLPRATFDLPIVSVGDEP